MPAASEKQAKLMRIVKAIQNKDVKASDYSEPAATMAKQMNPTDVEDMMTTEQIEKLKEIIRKTIREINTTANVQGYESPNAFAKKGSEKKLGKRAADLSGYTTVNEAKDASEKIKKYNDRIKKLQTKMKNTKSQTLKDKYQSTMKNILQRMSDLKKAHGIKAPHIESINENRWLELKNEESPAKAKIGRGISNINKQLNEIERFLNWYSRLKSENNVTNEQFWKRTNHNIFKIKERMIRLENILRKISE